MVRFDLSDFFSLHRLLYWRGILWRSQYWPIERQQNLKWKLLSGLLDHCYSRVPYYRETWRLLGLNRADLRSMEDLRRLPVLSKDVVIDRMESLRADNFQQVRAKPIRTAGTTGTPMQVYWDLDSNILELTCNWRHYSWFGYRLGTPFLDIRNFRRHLEDKWAWNWKCRGLETSSLFWDESNIGECRDMLKRRRIRMWRGHPTAIGHLCRLFRKAGIDDVRPDIVVSVAETLPKHERSVIEDWTGRPVGDSYGLIEHTALICQCPAGGYHIAPEYGVVEILKGDGTPAGPGEEGRIVATGLHNRAFPLLRYDTGDFAVASGETCACGRTLPLVKTLRGRVVDRILDAKGNWVSGVHGLFKYYDGIRASQVVQFEAGGLDVYLVPARNYDDGLRTLVASDIRRELGEDMTIRAHVVDEVPFPSTNKFRFVVNRIGKSAAE
ncbi:MAG: hypothetical protein QUS35_11950 [bacterium]|nr:hypothetical protein [bacterium]